MLLRFMFLILPLFILPAPLLLEPWLAALGDAEKMLAGTLPALLAILVVLLGLGLKHYRAVWLSLHLLLVGSVLQLLAVQPDENPARYTALLLASASLPLLQLLLLMLPERHLLSRYGVRRLILLFGPYATLLLLWHYAPLMLTEWLFTLPPSLLEYTFAGFTLSHGALAWNALLVFLCLGFVKSRPVDTIITIALTVAMLIGLSRPDVPLVGNSYHLLAQLMLVGTLIHHGYSMAFLDTLTGVPGRRALEHLLHSPGRRYVVAMLDIDHFKQFNDRYGHDTGDQVLRMVATQLSSVKAGGRLFRYGGEEFTIVFRGKQEGEALLALEQVRERVANYPLAIRDQGRPKDDTAGRQKRHNKEARKTVNVTISIGASENEPGETPEQVIKRADKALYLAKEQGRNCVRTGRERPRSRRRSRSDFAREAG